MEPMKLHVCGCISRFCQCNHRNGGDYWCTQYQCQYGKQIKKSTRRALLKKARVKANEEKKADIFMKTLVEQQREAQAEVISVLKEKWAREARMAASSIGVLKEGLGDFYIPKVSECQRRRDPRFDIAQCPHAPVLYCNGGDSDRRPRPDHQ